MSEIYTVKRCFYKITLFTKLNIFQSWATCTPLLKDSSVVKLVSCCGSPFNIMIVSWKTSIDILESLQKECRLCVSSTVDVAGGKFVDGMFQCVHYYIKHHDFTMSSPFLIVFQCSACSIVVTLLVFL